jgi:ATP-dependent Clp protease protease subunit
MNYLMKKAVNLNGQDMMLAPLDIDFAHRTISLTGVIDDEVATVLNSALRCLARDSDDDVTIYIQSPGGSVSAGFSIYDTVKALRCDIVTVACGMAASMGAFLLSAAGTKGKRWCQPNAEVLIHQPLGGTSGQATDIRIHAQHILNTREKLNHIFAECTGQSPDKIESDTERDYIMSATEALEYGLVDKIGDPISEW